MKNRKPLAPICLLLLILGGLACPPSLPAGETELSEYGNPFTWVRVGQAKVKAEVVITLEKMYLGLGHRQGLPEGRGMLFIMPSLALQNFCMRDMHFPIDIIWLVTDRVVAITKDISPKDPYACYPSPQPVDYVLEVPGGYCERRGIKVGDKAAW